MVWFGIDPGAEFPKICHCPSCGGQMYVFFDNLGAGLWFYCSKCNINGDALDFTAWNINSTIEDSIRLLIEKRLVFDPFLSLKDIDSYIFYYNLMYKEHLKYFDRLTKFDSPKKIQIFKSEYSFFMDIPDEILNSCLNYLFAISVEHLEYDYLWKRHLLQKRLKVNYDFNDHYLIALNHYLPLKLGCITILNKNHCVSDYLVKPSKGYTNILQFSGSGIFDYMSVFNRKIEKLLICSDVMLVILLNAKARLTNQNYVAIFLPPMAKFPNLFSDLQSIYVIYTSFIKEALYLSKYFNAKTLIIEKNQLLDLLLHNYHKTLELIFSKSLSFDQFIQYAFLNFKPLELSSLLAASQIQLINLGTKHNKIIILNNQGYYVRGNNIFDSRGQLVCNFDFEINLLFYKHNQLQHPSAFIGYLYSADKEIFKFKINGKSFSPFTCIQRILFIADKKLSYVPIIDSQFFDSAFEWATRKTALKLFGNILGWQGSSCVFPRYIVIAKINNKFKIIYFSPLINTKKLILKLKKLINKRNVTIVAKLCFVFILQLLNYFIKNRFIKINLKFTNIEDCDISDSLNNILYSIQAIYNFVDWKLSNWPSIGLEQDSCHITLSTKDLNTDICITMTKSNKIAKLTAISLKLAPLFMVKLLNQNYSKYVKNYRLLSDFIKFQMHYYFGLAPKLKISEAPSNF
ncbi:MAG: hypothetical protein QXV52_06795 [Nitrososphaeria archaeon]